MALLTCYALEEPNNHKVRKVFGKGKTQNQDT